MNLKKKAEFIIFRDGQLARGGDAFKHFRETNANNNKNHPTKLYGAWPHRPYNSRRGDLAPEMAKMVACHTPQDENIITWQQQPHLLDFAASTLEALMTNSLKQLVAWQFVYLWESRVSFNRRFTFRRCGHHLWRSSLKMKAFSSL